MKHPLDDIIEAMEHADIDIDMYEIVLILAKELRKTDNELVRLENQIDTYLF